MRRSTPRAPESRIPDRGRVGAGGGSVRRLGSRIGLVMLAVFDLLALEDITTAGAGMPETGFVLASVPALIALAWLASRGPAEGRGSGDDAGPGG